MTPVKAGISPAALAYLRSPQAVRERCEMVFDAVQAGKGEHFALDLAKLPALADYVVDTIRANHSDIAAIPYHSRWRHFSVGGIDRWKSLLARRPGLPAVETARMAIDLVVPSVLLDAGAGPDWSWRDPDSGAVVARSEGLALASLELFRSGALSDRDDDPCRTDAGSLSRLATEVVGAAFQVGSGNPLIGLEDRTDLLRRLGTALLASPTLFGAIDPRPGRLADAALIAARNGRLAAGTLFWMVMQMLAPVWPRREVLAGVSLGDVGRHRSVKADDGTAGLVPFHKLTQWMTYSLLEPLEWLGLTVEGLDELTGLPEYRNGGLFVDFAVLQPKHAGVCGLPHQATSELVVEWRALTVCLLDRIAEAIRGKLGHDAETLPLAKVLEGGTWSAGRRIAREKRTDGSPPITVISDGTIF